MDHEYIRNANVSTVIYAQLAIVQDVEHLPKDLTPLFMLTVHAGGQRVAGIKAVNHFAMPPSAVAAVYAQIKWVMEKEMDVGQVAHFERYYQAAWDAIVLNAEEQGPGK